MDVVGWERGVPILRASASAVAQPRVYLKPDGGSAVSAARQRVAAGSPPPALCEEGFACQLWRAYVLILLLFWCHVETVKSFIGSREGTVRARV
jgi:hypothetical protein